MHTPNSDEPLYVPEEFEAEHLEEARRRLASSRGPRRIARRVTSTVSRRRGTSARQQFLGVAALLHALAAVLAMAISALTGTWLIGLTLVALAGLSLATVVRVLHVVEQARERETVPPRQQR